MTISEKYISRHIIDLSKKFIFVRSTKDNPQALDEVLNYARHELEGYYPMEEFESNGIKSLLVHNTSERTKHFKLILNAHLDVVPGDKKQFYPYVKNGRLYGRGAYDMKAATTVMIYVFRQLAKSLPYPIGLQIVTDEENMGHDGAEYQIKKGVRADFAISGENSGLHVKNRAKGLLWIKLTALGKVAHGAYLWRGENAMWKLLNALQKIKEVYPIPSREVWQTTVNLSKIETPNTVFNNVPDNASAFLDFRVMPEDKDTVLEKVRSAIGPDIIIDVLTNDPSQYTPDGNEYVKLLQKSVENITGKTSELISSHAPSDIRHFNAAGYDGVEFGPDGLHQHADEEWVDIKSLEQYYFILKTFLLSVG